MRDEATPEAPAGLITVFGGSGFLGRHVVRALARRGWRIRVAVRRPDLAFHLQPLGGVGQIVAVQANVRYPESVARALDGADAVVNLVGIGLQRRQQTFAAVHDAGAGAIAAAAAGIAKLVHVSAIGADARSRSLYFRTKAAGEARLRAAMPGAVVIRPSIVFGSGDTFFNRIGRLVRMGPVVPLFHPGTRLQPVFAGDVAEAIALAVDGAIPPGAVYELGGPEVLTFRDCVGLVAAEAGRRRAILPMPAGFAILSGAILQRLPGRLLSADLVRSLKADNVVSPEAIAEGRTLEGLGIAPATLEVVLPTYLGQYRKGGSDERKLQ